MEKIIKGWVCKDRCSWRSDWHLAKFFEYKPVRVHVKNPPCWIWDEHDHWEMEKSGFEMELPTDMFPEITWKNKPIEVELTIKTL
jgi:hypothetical protein